MTQETPTYLPKGLYWLSTVVGVGIPNGNSHLVGRPHGPVPPAGFEPAPSGFEGHCPIR